MERKYCAPWNVLARSYLYVNGQPSASSRDATDRENLVNTILLAVTVALLLTPVFLAPSLWLVLPYILFLVVFVPIAEMFLWKSFLGTTRGSPEDVLATLALRLRRAGYNPKSGDRELSVPIGAGTVVKILATVEGGGTRLLYRADATPLGWLSLVGLPWIFLRARAWTREKVVPLLSRDETPVVPGPRDAVRVALLDGLHEVHHIASEAFLAERERYWNSQGVLAFGGLFAWFLLFLGISLTSSDPDLNRKMIVAAALASAVTAAVALPGGWLIRRRWRSRLLEAKAWVDRFGQALAREAASSSPETEGGGSLELLMESSPEVPSWLETARRAGLSQDPAAWLLVFVMVWVGVDILYGAPGFASFNLVLGFLLGALGLGILAASYVFYRRWRVRRDAALRRMREEWNRRYARVREAMERYLEGL